MRLLFFLIHRFGIREWLHPPVVLHTCLSSNSSNTLVVPLRTYNLDLGEEERRAWTDAIAQALPPVWDALPTPTLINEAAHALQNAIERACTTHMTHKKTTGTRTNKWWTQECADAVQSGPCKGSSALSLETYHFRLVSDRSAVPYVAPSYLGHLLFFLSTSPCPCLMYSFSSTLTSSLFDSPHSSSFPLASDDSSPSMSS